MLIWANLHLGFVLGLALVASLVVSLSVDRFILHQDVDLREPLVVLAACVGAAVINPNGPNLLVYPVTYMLPGDASHNLIAEWQTPNFHLPLHWPLLAGLAVLAVTGVNRWWGVLPAVLAVPLVVMALEASRNQPIFALALPALVGECWTKERVQDNTKHTAPGGVVWANWLLLATAISVFAVVLVPRTPTAQAGWDAPSDGYPVDAAQYVLRNYAPTRVFNSYNYGGYLIYAWYPQQKVFVDGRSDMYGARLLQDYSKVARLAQGWDQILDKYAIDVVLIERDSALASALRVDGRWEEDFHGTDASVFVRSPSPEEGP
jgi:hypothetical protein